MAKLARGSRRRSKTILPSEPTEEPPKPSSADSAPVSPSSGPLTIVGVGASAGGLEALGKFFTDMPVDSGLAFVVVQHLSPDYKSFMVELLSKRTAIPVRGAQDGLEVLPNHIYLIPPRKNLKIFQGRLLLVEPDLARGFNLPIDVFFRSLADEAQHHAIGVVLSGTGSDGTMGIRAIKDAGGMVMVQSEATAQFDGMPRSAIGTGLADFILSPEEMPGQLLQYLKHPFVAKEQAILRDSSSTDTLMHKVFALLREHSGVDFSFYKPSTIDRRIERRISINQLSNLDEYYQYLQASPREAGLLFNELLIGVTRFFRDRDAFDFLETGTIPDLLSRTPPGDAIRVWVPSCSTGEEAYSLAMLFLDAMQRLRISASVKIFATDISKSAIANASRGLYSESEVADVPPDRLKRYFVNKSGGWQVNQSLRQMVVFAHHNLLKDPPFTKLDLISCRNVLIYFQPTLQARVIELFHFALKSEGVLFLGSSESVGDMADVFHPVSTRHRIYHTRAAGRLSPETARSEPSRAWAPDATRVFRHTASGDVRLTEAIYTSVIDDYVPPCVVIDENNDILHVLGSAGDYLRPPAGSFTRSILKLTSHNLSVALAALLLRSERERKALTFDNVRFKQGRKMVVARLRVKPMVATERTGRGIRLVFIEPRAVEPVSRRESVEYKVSHTATQRIADLEQDLIYSRETLQATIEELETSNEELQATNEELLASNEELQSTNEELQSLNEELHTVNTENQNRIEELTELTNDINNLLATSRVATMLVDPTLRIRRMSAAFATLTSLRPSDVGAPLEVLSRELSCPELIELAQRVADGGGGDEHQVRLESGRVFLLRLAPYKTETDTTCGLVVTLIDVTDHKEREGQLQAVLDATPAHVGIVDRHGVVSYTNEAWRRFRRQPGGDICRGNVGDNYFDVCRREGSPDGVGEWLAAMEAVLAGTAPHAEMEYVAHVGSQPRWFMAAASPVAGRRPGLVITHLDITLRKQQTHGGATGIHLLELGAQPLAVFDLEDQVVTWNLGMERLTGWPADEVIGASLTRLVPQEALERQRGWHERARHGQVVACMSAARLSRAAGVIDVRLTVTPIFDAAGRVAGVSEVWCQGGGGEPPHRDEVRTR